ncbi:MAG: SDR family oxidoreductase [Alphaproteobacteria bacterium]
MPNLTGKKVLITGAAGGMGKAMVRRFQAAGALVCGTDIQTDGIEGAEAVIAGSLTDKPFADSLPETAQAALGGLDIVVNNAGLMRRGVITDATDEDFELSYAVNVEAPFRICRAAIPILNAAGGGAIVNVASCWGVHPGPGHPIYISTKAALASLTQCLGRDHAHQGIRVNAVCPNEVDTPMLRTGFQIRGLDPENGIAELDRSVPLGRIAQPEDIADVAVFLASDDARYMCGALVEVSGGKAVA